MTNITNLNKSSPENFELLFPILPGQSTLKDSECLTLNIFATVIPSITLETKEVDWMGAKSNWDSGGITFDNWYVNFNIDGGMRNWQLIYNWITAINNNQDRHGRPRPEYVVDASLHIMNNMRQPIMAIVFKNIWPTLLGEAALSYRDGDQVLASSVNFSYDSYVISTT